MLLRLWLCNRHGRACRKEVLSEGMAILSGCLIPPQAACRFVIRSEQGPGGIYCNRATALLQNWALRQQMLWYLSLKNVGEVVLNKAYLRLRRFLMDYGFMGIFVLMAGPFSPIRFSNSFMY